MTPSVKQEEYLCSLQRKKILIRTMRILLFILFFLFWEVFTRAGILDDFIFCSPSRIIKTMISMISDHTLFYHVGITLFETLISFLLVIICTLVLTILLWLNDTISKIFEPYLVVLNSLPKSALAPLLIVWLGANYKTIIVTGMSVAIFGSILSLYGHFMEADPDQIKLIRILGGSKADILFKIMIPANIPHILALMKVDIGLCLVGVIIGEFIASRRGLGYLIIYGSQVFKMDWVLMAIIILCIVAIILYSKIGLLEKLLVKDRSS